IRSRIAGSFQGTIARLAARDASAVGPTDSREMSVAAGVLETQVVIREPARGALRGGELRRIWMRHIFEPDHLFARADYSLDRDLGDLRDRHRPRGALSEEGYRRGPGWKQLCHHRAEQRRRSARCAGEDVLERRALFRGRAVIHID